MIATDQSKKKISIAALLWALIIIAVLLNVLILGLFKNVISDYNAKSYKLAGFERGLNSFKLEVGDYFKNEIAHLNLMLVARPIEDQPKVPHKSLSGFSAYRIIADNPKLKPLIKEISVQVDDIYSLEDKILSWRLLYAPIAQDINENTSLNKVRSIIEALNNSVLSFEGKQKLKESKKLRQIKIAAPDQSALLSQQYIKDFLGNTDVDFNALKFEINDLSLFIERLNSETNLDDLPDLRDNKIKQSLERIQKTLFFKDQNSDEFSLLEDLVNQLSAFVFGQDFHFDKEYQTIVMGQGGYFTLKQEYLLLLKNRDKLISSLDQIELSISKVLLKFNEAVFVLRHDVVEDQKKLFADIWQKVLGLSLLLLSIFLLVSFYIIFLVKKQIAKEQKTRDEINALIEGTGDAMRVVDRNFNVIRVNSKMAELTGVSAQDSIGKKCYDLFPGNFCDSRNCTLKLVLEKERIVQSENLKKDKDGIYHPFDVIAAPLRENGKIVSIIESYRDVSDYVKLQHEIELKNDVLLKNQQVLNQALLDLQKSHRELKETQGQLVRNEKMASIGMLSAGVAHEINNPISYVLGNLEVLVNNVSTLIKIINEVESLLKRNSVQDGQEINKLYLEFESIVNTEEVRFMMNDLPLLVTQSVDGAKRVQRIVKNLKDFAHPGVENKKLIDVNVEIESSLLIIHNEVKYNCEVVKNFQSVPLVYANAQQLNQVFINIIVNAAQSITSSGIIQISTYSLDSYVVVEVSDNGCGIAKDDINKIFNPFYTTKDVGKGTGLGLSIVYGLVEEHGGKILVESEVGVGSKFKVFLPATK